MNSATWNIVAWSVLTAAVLALEFLGVVNPDFLTITHVIKAYVPAWVRAMIWGWLGWHFLWNK